MNYTIANLKNQIDYNYQGYKDQKKGLQLRKNQLKKSVRHSLIALLIIPVTSFILGSLAFFLTEVQISAVETSFENTIFSMIITIFSFVGIFGMVVSAFWCPLQLKVFLDTLHKYNLLNGKYLPDFINIKTDYVTFNEEEKFLNRKISEIDHFYTKFNAIYDSDDYESDEETDAAIIDEMRSLSIWVNYSSECSIIMHDGMIKYIQFLIIFISLFIVYAVAHGFGLM
jgi:hypothetical protein